MVMPLKRRYDIYIEDMIDAIERIQEYASEDEPLQRPMARDAIFWNFHILGEAVGQLPDEIREQHSEIPWREVRDFRNIVVHKYWEVDTAIVREIIEDRLPGLHQRLTAIRAEE